MTLNVFSAGRDLVRWEVTAVSADGPYRLGVYHPGGAIVEYFTSVSAALLAWLDRQGLPNVVVELDADEAAIDPASGKLRRVIVAEPARDARVRRGPRAQIE